VEELREEERREKRAQQAKHVAALERERDALSRQFKEVSRERDALNRQLEEVSRERDTLRLQLGGAGGGEGWLLGSSGVLLLLLLGIVIIHLLYYYYYPCNCYYYSCIISYCTEGFIKDQKDRDPGWDHRATRTQKTRKVATGFATNKPVGGKNKNRTHRYDDRRS